MSITERPQNRGAADGVGFVSENVVPISILLLFILNIEEAQFELDLDKSA